MIETEKDVAADTQRPLPDGWRWVRLSDICELNPRRPALLRANDTPTTFIPMSAIGEGGMGIVAAEVRPYDSVKSGYTYFVDGDVLFAKITPCMQNGKHAIARDLIDGFGLGSTEFHVIHSKGAVMPEWIHGFIMQPHVLEAAKAHFTGAVGQQRVPESYLKELEIPLPLLAEQRRIAAVLREQMTAVEQARAAAEAQLEAARALPAAYLRAVFESDEAQEWREVNLGDICEGPGQYGTSELAHSEPVGVPVLRMGNLYDGHIIWDDLKYVALSGADTEKYRLARGDILFNRTNSAELVGKTAVFDSAQAAIFASYLIRFRTRPQVADPWFISYYINSAGGRAFIAKNMARAIGQVNISASTMHALPVPLPSNSEQRRIAATLDGQMAGAQQLRRTLQEQRDAIEALPAALLRQAFSGEL